MFRNFFELKSELAAKGEKFTEDTLKLISYADLHRAAIGDAGQAACDLELVEKERNYRQKKAEWQPPELIEALGMTEDMLIRKAARKLDALPNWVDLSPLAQVYLSIRCLRSHADNPGPRLDALEAIFAGWNPLAITDRPVGVLELMVTLRMATSDLRLRLLEGAVLTVQDIRTAYRGFEQLTKFVSNWERAVLLTRNINGYTCTAGCFLPVDFED